MSATDEQCRAAIEAMKHSTVHGFSTPTGDETKRWGPPHFVRDCRRPAGQQELWRGNSHEEMMERIEIEKMRLALDAANPALAEISR